MINLIRVVLAIVILLGLFLTLTMFKFSPYLLTIVVLVGHPAYKLCKKIVFKAAKLIDSSINDVI